MGDVERLYGPIEQETELLMCAICALVNRDFFMGLGPFSIRNFQLPVDRFHRSRSGALHGSVTRESLTVV